MSNEQQRNELADEMTGWTVSSGYYGQSLGSEVAQEIAEHLIAAGYRKPRTIETEEELDALPVGSVIKDRDRDVCQRFRDGWRATIHEPNDDPWLTDTLEVDLPATVLHEGAL